MSRSFKHTPVLKYGGGKPEKRNANKKVRRLLKESSEEALAGKSNGYRRVYPQYNVCDYRFWGEPIWRAESLRNISDDKNYWEKVYRRK